MRQTAFEEVLARSALSPNGCLLWAGSRSKGGYGRFRHELAHRVAWANSNGPIPPNMIIDHVCHNRAAERGECAGGVCAHKLCVNIEHLRVCTQKENLNSSPLYRGRTWPAPPDEHGTRRQYIHRGCRCEPCKEAARTYRRALRLKVTNKESDAKNGDDKQNPIENGHLEAASHVG